jgi:epoxyqueuosine reductase
MVESGKKSLSVLIKNKAFESGFDLCGIAKARSLDEYGPVLRSWCEAGMNDNMNYLGRNIEKRLNPEYLLPGVKSLIVTGISYFSEIKQRMSGVPILSRYAYGINYHDVITSKLADLIDLIKTIDPKAEGRIVVDSAPLLEKEWAHEAGLGWQGKHSVLISRKIGSFFFIGTLLLNIELDYDLPFKGEHCGECTLCIESCPTGAINDNRTIDARKCIANLTIENRGPIPDEIIPRLGRRVYGCDRCQEVCPWNYRAKPHQNQEFNINEEVAALRPEDWQSLTREQFTRLFQRSAVERVKYEHFISNIKAAFKSEV